MAGSFSRCPENCLCLGMSIYGNESRPCSTNNKTSDMDEPFHGVRIIDVSGNPKVLEKMKLEDRLLFYLEFLNISFCNITVFPEGFFASMLALEVLDISFNKIQRLSARMFFDLQRLRTLRIKGNTESLLIEKNAFLGLTKLENLELSHLNIDLISGYAFAGVKVNSFRIDFSEIKNLEEKAFGNLTAEEMYLETSKLYSFSNLLFGDMRNVTKLVTQLYQFCCIRPYYLAEKNCYPKRTVFSTCADLLGNETGRYVLWILGLICILNNLMSIMHHFSFDLFKLNNIHTFFLLNLSLSDVLMGIYIAVIAAVDITLRGRYASGEDVWRSSTKCQIATIVSLVSVLTGSFFLMTIALSRLLVIKYPTVELQLTRRLSMSLVVTTWSMVFFVSCLVHVRADFLSFSGVCSGFPLKGNGSNLKYFLMVMYFAILGVCLCGYYGVYKETTVAKEGVHKPRFMRKEDLRTSRNILVLVTIDAVCLMAVYVQGETEAG